MSDTPSKVVVIGLDGAVPTLVVRWAAEGRLPNLAKLMREGAFLPSMSVLPGVTPVNWASVATGAHPHTHGIVDFRVHLPGDALDESRFAFDSRLVEAEFLWESAADAGKRCLVVNFPGGWPPRHQAVHWIGGTGSPSSRSELQISPSACFVPPDIRLRDATPTVDGKFSLGAEGAEGAEGPEYRADWAQDHVRLTRPNREVLELRPDEWSPWLQETFRQGDDTSAGSFRFKLTDGPGNGLRLYCSQVYPSDGFTQPAGLAKEILEAVGPYVDYCGPRGVDRNWVDGNTLLEEAEYKLDVIARSIAHLHRRYGYDLVFTKTHLLDHLAHTYWGGLDQLSPWSSREDAPENAGYIRRGYELADHFVGQVREALGSDFGVVVLSDHGQLPHLKAMSPNNVLKAAGLLAINPGVDGPEVDWARTRAYAATCLGHVYVNLAGRDPQGIVAPNEYHAIEAAIQDALLSVRDPETGERVVELAIPNRHADVLGQGGPRAGDVVYAMRPGYSGDTNWFPLTADGASVVSVGPHLRIEADLGERKFVAGKFQSVHGCSLPTAELGAGTELALLIMAGPGIKPDYRRARPSALTDVAPTIAAWLGLPPPAESEGRVFWDIFAASG